ncbi:MAG: hypothetical protein PWQ50_1479, partial [Methanolobus sp.]|nr:hypothetical protein [Methanolobus sp.]
MRNKLKLILFGLIILMFTGGAMAAASLSGGAIDSSTGYIDTTFDFTVTYTDTDNISASYVNVAIDGTPYAMAETDSGDVNTSDGKDYAYSNSGFTVGTHSYEFYADNGGGEVGPFDAGTFTISNTAPVLSSSGVSPGSGSPATSFTFSVTYTDADNNASSYMNVTIDGVSYAMSESDAGDTDYTDGKVYSYSSTFATGTHTYNFSASDGVDSVGPTADDTFSVNSDSSISGTVSPSSGTPSDTFYFNATFTDADNDLPTYIRAIINGTTYDMNEVDAGDVTTTDGKLYTYSITGFPIGSHTYKFTASDGTSTPETAQQSFDVDVSNHQPTLTDDEVTADSFIVGESIFFNVIYTDSDNDAPSFNYVQIDGTNKTMFKVDSDDDTATNGIEYTYNTTLALGTHTYRFFASDGTYEVNTASKNVTIYSKTYFTGDRIWDVNANQSDDYYIWDAKSFSGFFYDLESGLSSENMTISNIDRSLGDGDIVYQTRPVETDFEHSDWGSYQVIGFMAEKYFAAYTDKTDIDDVDEVSMMSSGQLSKILLDDDDKESVFSGSSLILEDGYELNVVEVDVNGNNVYVTLTKDGDELDSGVISSGEDYVYKTDLGDADDVVLIAIHISSVFSGTESNAVFIQGVFQISEDYVELDDGETYGEMEVTSISDDLIEMENDGTVSLSKGKSITLMGKIKLIVADNDDLRFAPYVDMSDPGTYELRGTVAEDDDLLTWTPLNFEGFYYDIDEGIQTETLELTAISGRTIDDGDLVYTSTPASVEFEHSDWGEFQVIGFMAEKYFAGYTDNTDVDDVDEVSLMSNGQLSKVLLDDDDKASVYSGSSLILEE